MPTQPEPIRVFFQEIKPGDVLKLAKESNVSPSGGGARDLRFPAVPYSDLLTPMFPEEIETGHYRGDIHWQRGGKTGFAPVELWPPTSARPSEARIGRFYEVEGWAVDDDAIQRDFELSKRWFVVLAQLDNGQVWAAIKREEDLDSEPGWFADCVRRKLVKTPSGRAARGFISRVDGELCV